MTLNGTEVSWQSGLTLTGLLQDKGYDISRVAVLRGGQVIPRSEYDTTLLEENDTLEAVSFVGGG